MKSIEVIAVTGLNAIDSPGPGVAVIRCLRKVYGTTVRIIGLAYENLEPGIYLPGITDKTYQVPYPSGGLDALSERIKTICRAESPDMIIPCFDAELASYIQLRSTFSEWGISMVLPTPEQFEARQKHRLPDWGKKYDIAVPKSTSINTEEQIHQIKNLRFPFFVKGRFYEAYKAHSMDQAVALFRQISSKWGPPVIFQEAVTGEEFNVSAIGDGKGNTVGMTAMKKMFVTNAGKAWSGITVFDDALTELTETLVKNTGWNGPLEIEMLKPVDGPPTVIEINPRFPAWVYLTAIAGQNQPEILLNLARGEHCPVSPTYDAGKLFIRYSSDMEVDLETFQQFSTLGESGDATPIPKP